MRCDPHGSADGSPIVAVRVRSLLWLRRFLIAWGIAAILWAVGILGSREDGFWTSSIGAAIGLLIAYKILRLLGGWDQLPRLPPRR